MLHTTIQTTDEAGKELPIPPDLRAKVQRAAKILGEVLRGVGEKFDIDVRWRFACAAGSEVEIQLILIAPSGAMAGPLSVTYPFPKEDLSTDESIRRALWKPIKPFTDILSEEVDREFKRLRSNLQSLVTTAEE
jgi:hypothetical protein